MKIKVGDIIKVEFAGIVETAKITKIYQTRETTYIKWRWKVGRFLFWDMWSTVEIDDRIEYFRYRVRNAEVRTPKIIRTLNEVELVEFVEEDPVIQVGGIVID